MNLIKHMDSSLESHREFINSFKTIKSLLKISPTSTVKDVMRELKARLSHKKLRIDRSSSKKRAQPSSKTLKLGSINISTRDAQDLNKTVVTPSSSRLADANFPASARPKIPRSRISHQKGDKSVERTERKKRRHHMTTSLKRKSASQKRSMKH